jgi:hypothetical protein
MLTDQGLWFDHDKSTLPVEPLRPPHESVTSHIGKRLRPELVFLVEGQLLSQK